MIPLFSLNFGNLTLGFYDFQTYGVNSSSKNDHSVILIKKNLKCESSLGLPNDGEVCKFILNNVKPSQFNISIKGNNTQIITLQGSNSGTNITLNSGPYVITEQPFDTTDIESLLGETATMDTKTDTLGDCLPSYDLLDEFQNITGNIKPREYQHCTIINTIGVNEGDAPES